ncbi:MAG: hypothetical protein EP332_03515 [Bacteroidetes bacterium]|nr:MAG: hypothetical protein EP332_03515 [Bacteroidota bacterium]
MMFKKKITQPSLQILPDGFSIVLGDEQTTLNWSEIEKITAYKVDRFTVDEVQLSIAIKDAIVFVSEEMENWMSFVEEMSTQLPELESDWIVNVTLPAFERNERVIYTKSEIN